MGSAFVTWSDLNFEKIASSRGRSCVTPSRNQDANRHQALLAVDDGQATIFMTGRDYGSKKIVLNWGRESIGYIPV
jgi:hypothetical protein